MLDRRIRSGRRSGGSPARRETRPDVHQVPGPVARVGDGWPWRTRSARATSRPWHVARRVIAAAARWHRLGPQSGQRVEPGRRLGADVLSGATRSSRCAYLGALNEGAHSADGRTVIEVAAMSPLDFVCRVAPSWSALVEGRTPGARGRGGRLRGMAEALRRDARISIDVRSTTRPRHRRRDAGRFGFPSISLLVPRASPATGPDQLASSPHADDCQ